MSKPNSSLILLTVFLPVVVACGVRAKPAPPPTSAVSSAISSLLPQELPGRELPKSFGAPSEVEVPDWAGKTADEPFDVRAFLTSRASPSDNAAPIYEAAFEMLRMDIGREPLENRIRELAHIEKLMSGTVPTDRIEQVLASVAPAMERIDQAQGKLHCVFVTGLTADALMPHAIMARTVGRCSILLLYQARAKGDFALAEASIQRCLRLSRDLRPRGHFACQMVSIANDSLLLSAIERVTLTDKSLTCEQCDRLLALLAEHQQEGLDPYQEGTRMDYILARSSIHDLRIGRLTLDQIFGLLSSAQDANPSPIGTVPMNFDAEIAACNRLYTLAIAATSNRVVRPDEFAEFHSEKEGLKGDWERFISKVAQAPPSTRASLQAEMPAMQFGTWTAGIVAGREASLRSAANLAGLQVLIALRRYEMAHGRLPTVLADAAEETILKTVPTDPYSGGPFHFALVDGKPAIYSIGNDLKDDGGQVDWKFGTQPGDYLFVFPAHAGADRP
jgi:hypothetical protein